MAALRNFKLVYTATAGAFDAAQLRIKETIAAAATGAIKETGNQIKTSGRREIGAGGFSSKWQNALRVNFYPRRGNSTKAALFVYHKIPYAGIFERGGTVHGKPLLWIPIGGARFGRQRSTPERFKERYGPLIRIVGPSGNPILLGKASVTTRGYRKQKKYQPIFVGLTSVSLRKRFNLTQVFSNEARKLHDRYYGNLKVD